MLTLSAAGKSTDDIEKLIQESLTDAGDDEELKILIDGPAQASQLTKLLESFGFNDVVPEDDLKKARRAGTTAGFPRSHTGQPKRTTGASGKSCGKSRSLRSRSSGGERESTQTAT